MAVKSGPLSNPSHPDFRRDGPRPLPMEEGLGEAAPPSVPHPFRPRTDDWDVNLQCRNPTLPFAAYTRHFRRVMRIGLGDLGKS